MPQSAPTAQMPNRSVKIEQPEDESFDGRSDFLGDLNSMERMISTDVSRLQSQVNEEDSSEDNELLEALEESKALLRKIKALQRREIEKRARSLGSPKPMRLSRSGTISLPLIHQPLLPETKYPFPLITGSVRAT